MSMWFVPLSSVLDAYGHATIKPYAFATSAVAALISPLLFGTMADRHLGAVAVLRWLAIGLACAFALTIRVIEHSNNSLVVLRFIQLQILFSTPTWSIVNAVVLAGVANAGRDFGPIRALGTVGWMCGCWVVSALHADVSTLATICAMIAWLVVAAFTFFLPNVVPERFTGTLSLRQRFGLDALQLLKHPDHKAVFVTAALVTIPLTAFYPFTTLHLKQLGFERTAAWMTLGQITEVIAMFSLATLLTHWRLKWIFTVGLSCALVRYVLCAFNKMPAVLAGISLHGFAFTLFFVTAPVYLDGRVETASRARAQALMTLMTTGVGSLIGYLGCGWWFNYCSEGQKVRWELFWAGLAASVLGVFAYFVISYRGLPAGKRGAETPSSKAQGP